MDPEDNADHDRRASTQKTIADGVALVLAIRTEEHTLENMSHEFHGFPPTHNMDYIIQAAKVDKMKRELDGIVGRLAALPHAPVRVEPDVAPFRTWMNMHRVQFEEFKTYCDEYRPKSPREDGEVHPAVENMAGCVQRLTQRVDELAPLVYPEAFELQRRAEVLAEAHRRTGQVFWEAMGKFSLEELGEQGLRLAIEQRALQVAHATLDGIVRMREGPGETEVLCWLEPVDSQNGEAVDENMELDELEGWW